MATAPTLLDLAQYDFELGDTTDVIVKDNARNAALDTFSSQLNTMVTDIETEQQQTISTASGHATDAGNSATAAAGSATLAGKWASEAEDVEVEPGEYSAYHWKQKAQAIATGNLTVVDLLPGAGTTGQVVTVNGTGDLAWADLLWAWLTNVPATASRWPAWGEVTAKPTFATVATSGRFTDLSAVPATASRWPAWGEVTSKPTFAAVATSGSYTDLTDTPPAGGEMAALDKATSSQIRSMTGEAGVTSAALSGAASPATLSDTATPAWGGFVSASMTLSDNRTLANPTGVIAGTTRVIRAASNSTTTRILSFGTAYKGAPASIEVTDSSVALLTLHAVSSSEVVVSIKEYTA